MSDNLKLSELRSALQQEGIEVSDEQFSRIVQGLENRLPKQSEYKTWAEFFARDSSVTDDFVEILKNRNNT